MSTPNVTFLTVGTTPGVLFRTKGLRGFVPFSSVESITAVDTDKGNVVVTTIDGTSHVCEGTFSNVLETKPDVAVGPVA